MKWFFYFAYLFGALALSADSALSQSEGAQQPTITVDAAEQLARKALEPGGAAKLPHFGLEKGDNPMFPEFYFFQALWDNPAGSAVIENLAVDRNTGDVWDAVVCRELESRGLRQL